MLHGTCTFVFLAGLAFNLPSFFVPFMVLMRGKELALHECKAWGRVLLTLDTHTHTHTHCRVKGWWKFLLNDRVEHTTITEHGCTDSCLSVVGFIITSLISVLICLNLCVVASMFHFKLSGSQMEIHNY